ncbi:MAG: hypothetical protein U9R42_09820, partial [Bacteroidota bacterium]|nr:hypothetical protein [Bacteroidota bacterium]
IINNLTALKFFSIATAIQKNLCLASYSLSLFLKRNVFKEPPLYYFFVFLSNKFAIFVTK